MLFSLHKVLPQVGLLSHPIFFLYRAVVLTVIPLVRIQEHVVFERLDASMQKARDNSSSTKNNLLQA